jgi:diguanylate cyclase (GGDEF)-like protein
MLLNLLRRVMVACVLAAAAPAIALSAGAASGPAAVSVARAEWPLALAGKVDVFEDREGRLDLAQLWELPPERWSHTDGRVLNAGFSRSIWWVRLRLHNPGAQPAPRIVELAPPLHDDVQVWLLHPADASPVRHWHTGDRLPFESRGLAYPTFLFPLMLEAGQDLDFYVRIQSHDGLQEAIDLQLWDDRSLLHDGERTHLAFGLYYGALLALLFYNLFLYASTRITLYALYVAHLGVFFIWNFSFRGFAFQFWWPNHPWWANQVLPISATCAFLVANLFAMRYMQTRIRAPAMHRLLRGSQGLTMLCLPPALAGLYAPAFAMLGVASITSMILNAATGVVLLRRGSRPARFYLLAWSMLGAGVCLYLLRMAAVLPATPLTSQAPQIGSVLEFLLLAFGLADRMKQLEVQKEQAQRAALEARAALTGQLEAQVQERTRALEGVNRQLAEMAITDELTGAYNRRRFNEVFAPALRGQARGHEGIALALLDVDFFKAFNDRYGHPEGDRALQAVSGAVRALLKRSEDAFFRVGGEEFAVLMRAQQLDAAHRFLETLCRRVADLRVPHDGSPHGCVTLSAGLVFLPASIPPQAPQAVFARADALLYEAKATGRNRVVSAKL